MKYLRAIGNAIECLYNFPEKMEDSYRRTSLFIFLIMAPLCAFLASMIGIGYYLLPLLIPDSFFFWLNDITRFKSQTATAGDIGLLLAYGVLILAMYVSLFGYILVKRVRS